MLTIGLTIVTVTHLWIGEINTLVKVCKYYSKREVSWYYYHYPAIKIVNYDSSCPSYIKVKKK